MENKHLTYFKVENFKKFDALEVKDIGQFNLIVGDNNVGKTCLLEALLVDGENASLSKVYFLKSLYNRGIYDLDLSEEHYYNKMIKLNHLSKGNLETRWKLNKIESTINFNTGYIQMNTFGSSAFNRSFQKYVLSIERETFKYLKINLKNDFFELLDENFNYPLVSFNANSEDDILNLYNKLTTKKGKENLISALRIIFPTIENVEYKVEFESILDTYIFSFEEIENFIPLNYMGDGFKRIFYIALKALSLKGKRILIDEVEIGIHHSKMKDFWVNIMKVCKELDVQLFATTHSKECIESFTEASKEIDEKDIRLIRLQENKDKSIKAICYQSDAIEYIVESNTEER